MTPPLFPTAIPSSSEVLPGSGTVLPTADVMGFARALASEEARGAEGPTPTPMSGDAAATAIARAYEHVTGASPSKETLAVLVSQWALETGGGRAMMNYNFGGIKARSSDGAVSYRTLEGSGDEARSVLASFRAYGSAQEGANDYVKLLHDRYPGALAQARNGQAAGFVRELKRGGYFTGSETDYTSAVESTARRVLAAGFDAASTAGGAASNWQAGLGATPYDVSGADVDVASFSYQLDLAALRIGMDPDPR